MPEPQSYKNHTRFDPLYHFITTPLLLLNLIAAIVWTVRHHGEHPHLGYWMIGMAIVLFLMQANIRLYPLKAQDRVIRVEERLRLKVLLPADQLQLLNTLTPAQFVALRFASDGEVAALAQRASRENLTPKQIKQSITTWRADDFRV